MILLVFIKQILKVPTDMDWKFIIVNYVQQASMKQR
jgi:hypothetical protein